MLKRLCLITEKHKFPKIIISDQSMVFILAALKEFNNEDLSDILKRSYKIGQGQAPVMDCQKTIVHLCKSHLKRYLRKKEISLQKVRVSVYMIEILMKCNHLTELLLYVFIAVSCKTLPVHLNHSSQDSVKRSTRSK